MRKTLFTVLCALAALAFGGCLFGGEGDVATAAKTDSTGTVAKIKKLTPGVYVANYPWLDSNMSPLESEFILDSNGSFRLFWIQDNEAFDDFQGNWSQHDSNLFFGNTKLGRAQNGIFHDFKAIEDDTNAVREVTDTSFIRREYAPVRQKPLWISYILRAFPALKNGSYLTVKTYPKDSTSTLDVKFKITLDGSKYFFDVVEDTLESFQASAKWYQVGSFLATEENLQRQLDSTMTFPAVWDTLGGLILTRLKTVSDTSFRLWSPETFYDTASWDPYRRL